MIHLVFDDDTTNVQESNAYYTKSTDGGLTYSTPVNIAPGASLAIDSSLALDAAGNVYVAWTGVKAGASGLAVFLSKSTDGGNSFTAPVAVSLASQNADLANIAVDRNGNILATYLEVSTNSPKVFAARSTSGGSSFSSPVQISNSRENFSGIAAPISFFSTGAPLLVYRQLASPIPTINLAVASDGQRFSTPRVISDPSVAAFAPHLAIDRGDNLYVTFYNRQLIAPFFSREVMLIKSSDKGNTFRSQIDASNNLGQ